jgi:hypothetical protein
MTIEFPEDAFKHVITWQTKLKKHKQQSEVIEMDTLETSGKTKDSHENLHVVNNATDHIKDWRTFWKDVLEEDKDPLALAEIKDKVIKDFLDTISLGLEELSGKEILDCFIQAVENEHTYRMKESNKVSELFNLLLQPK